MACSAGIPLAWKCYSSVRSLVLETYRYKAYFDTVVCWVSHSTTMGADSLAATGLSRRSESERAQRRLRLPGCAVAIVVSLHHSKHTLRYTTNQKRCTLNV
jgi:hypothetical protein